MKVDLHLCLYALLVTIVIAGCATASPRFKRDSDDLFIRLKGSEAATLFPLEFRDIYQTLHKGDDQLSAENIDGADTFYLFAIGKIELLEKHYNEEVKRREETARLDLELQQRRAAESLRLKQELEHERIRAEEAVKSAARAKKLEAEKTEARKSAEHARLEKDVPQAATHTVKRGETLPQIAALAEVYGDSSLWPLLYRANRDQISNPAVLWPGQVLRIPRVHDRNELNEARRFSSDRQIR